MAFRATQALRMVVKKTSTGLVGLAVDVNARANFIALQKQILEKIKVKGTAHTTDWRLMSRTSLVLMVAVATSNNRPPRTRALLLMGPPLLLWSYACDGGEILFFLHSSSVR